MTITVTESPEAADRQAVLTGLAAFNRPLFGESGTRPLAVVLHNEAQQVIGGALGRTHWGWLYIEALWVAEAHRGQGWGTRLLAEAEKEAHRRGCRHAYLDTFSDSARRLYERCGYTLFTVQTDFPPGQNRYFLRKDLAA